MHFVDTLHDKNFKPDPKHQERVELFYMRFASSSVSYNAVEIIFLLIMRSFYTNVTQCINYLYESELSQTLTTN
jgi:hypothetical protein